MASTIPTIQKINAGVKRVKGGAWEYKIVGPKYVLKKIYVSHSQYAVDCLQFVVSDDQGRETIVSEKYGDNASGAGTNFTIVELGVGEQITTVSGYYYYDLDTEKHGLASITFSTGTKATHGQSTHAQYGGRGRGRGSTYGRAQNHLNGGRGSTYGPYGSSYDSYGYYLNGGRGSSYDSYEDHLDAQRNGQSGGEFINSGSNCLYGLPFCIQMGQSFAGFHGTIIDGQLESIGVFINDQVVKSEPTPAAS